MKVKLIAVNYGYKIIKECLDIYKPFKSLAITISAYTMENKELEKWLAETKAEFSPKRGDRVLVWDESENEAEEAIFFDKIGKNIIVFGDESEFDDFIVGKRFISDQFKHMKPLPTEQPTETYFKSKVIEFIEGKINATTTALETIIGIQKDLLEQVKNIC